MPTYTPSSPIDGVDSGQRPPEPPLGGGNGDHGNNGGPDYGARLRRARLGLICAIATVGMIFISLTSALIVRRGLPTFEGSSNTYVHDWGVVQLPWGLLLINTLLLRDQQRDDGIGATKRGAESGARSGELDSGSFAGK